MALCELLQLALQDDVLRREPRARRRRLQVLRPGAAAYLHLRPLEVLDSPLRYTIRYTHRQQTRDSRDADERSPRPVSALAFPPNRPRTKGQGLEPSIELVSTRPRAGAAGGRLDGVDAIRRPARAGRAAGGPGGGPEGAGRPSAPPDSSTLHTGLITRVLDSRCWQYCGRAGRTCRSGPSPGRSRRRWARRPPRA